MSEIDNNSSQDLLSRVTVLGNELENLQNHLTQILIHNKSIQVLTDEIYHNQDSLYNNEINCSRLNQLKNFMAPTNMVQTESSKTDLVSQIHILCNKYFWWHVCNAHHQLTFST